MKTSRSLLPDLGRVPVLPPGSQQEPVLPVRTVQSPRPRRGAHTGLEPPLHGERQNPRPALRRSLRSSTGAAALSAIHRELPPPPPRPAPPEPRPREEDARGWHRYRGSVAPARHTHPTPPARSSSCRSSAPATEHQEPLPGASPSSGGSAKPGSTQRSRVVYFCYGHITESSPLPWPRSPGSGCWLPKATEAAASGIELSAAPAGALDPPPLQQCLCFFLFL